MVFTPEHIFTHERVSLSHYAAGGVLRKTFSSLFSTGSRRHPSTSEGVNKTSKIAAQSLGRRREKRERRGERTFQGRLPAWHTTQATSQALQIMRPLPLPDEATTPHRSLRSQLHIIINHDLEIIALLSQLIRLNRTAHTCLQVVGTWIHSSRHCLPSYDSSCTPVWILCCFFFFF